MSPSQPSIPRRQSTKLWRYLKDRPNKDHKVKVRGPTSGSRYHGRNHQVIGWKSARAHSPWYRGAGKLLQPRLSRIQPKPSQLSKAMRSRSICRRHENRFLILPSSVQSYRLRLRSSRLKATKHTKEKPRKRECNSGLKECEFLLELFHMTMPTEPW